MDAGLIKLKPMLFWNVELRYLDQECGQIYTELDLVAQVRDRLYIFEIKCDKFKNNFHFCRTNSINHNVQLLCLNTRPLEAHG